MDELEQEATTGNSVAQNSESIPAESSTPEKSSLPQREALRHAIREHREPQGEAPEHKPTQGDDADAPKAGSQPTSGEVKTAIDDGAEPPAEFSAAAKKAWAEGNTKAVLAEYRRIHEKRTEYITSVQNKERTLSEREQKAKTWADLGDRIAPYLKAKGDEGDAPEKAIMNAVALAEALRAQDGAAVKEALKAQGIDLDKAPGSPAAVDISKSDDFQAMKKTVDSLLEQQQRQVFAAVRSSYATALQELGSEKTRTGEPVFPDLFDESEKGMQLAREIGSLTNDPRFVQGVVRRVPEATHTDLVREAYKYLGGRVSAGEVKVSQEQQQKHTERARRAAASTPSRMVSRDESAALKGKLSKRAALKRAIAEHREH